MKIVQIPLLRDNYGYLIVCDKTKNAAIIDPSEADPVLARIDQEQVPLQAILNTHHHRDHTGGNEGILAKHQAEVYGHKSDSGRIHGLSCGVDEGDEIQIGELKGAVLFIPGHTTGHVAYLFENNLFCGDTLFTAGCGRLFEGTPEQMQSSLKKLMTLPDNTKSLLRPRIHREQSALCHVSRAQKSQTGVALRARARLTHARHLHGAFDDRRGETNQPLSALGQQRNSGPRKGGECDNSSRPGFCFCRR